MFKRGIYFIFCFFLTNYFVTAQNKNKVVDSLLHLASTKPDTSKVKILGRIARILEGNNPDSAAFYADSALKIAKRINYSYGIATSYAYLGSAQTTSGKYDLALKNLISSADVFEKAKNKIGLTNVLHAIGNTYLGMKNNDKAFEYYLKAYTMANQSPADENMVAVTSFGIGNMLAEQKKSK